MFKLILILLNALIIFVVAMPFILTGFPKDESLRILLASVLGGAMASMVNVIILRSRRNYGKGKLTNLAAARQSWYSMNRYLRAFYTSLFVYGIGMWITKFIGLGEAMDDVVIFFGFPMCILTGIAVAFMLRKNSSTVAGE